MDQNVVEAGAKGNWKEEGFTLSHEESTWEPTGTEHLDITANHPKHGVAGIANFTKQWNSKGEECWYPNNVSVEKWAQRKGLGTAMVEYVVEATGIKLANTIDLSADGKELAKKVDPKLVVEAGANGNWKEEGYEIHISGPVDFEDADDGEAEAFMKENPELRPIDIYATSPEGEHAGECRVGLTKDKKFIYVWDVNVEKEHQRKGLASAMYRMAEKHFKKKLKPGVTGLSDDSKALWEQPNRSFGGANGVWEKEGIEIKAFTKRQEACDFIDQHTTSFGALFCENIPGAFNSFAIKGDEIIGYACFTNTTRGLVPIDTKVLETYRRKGIASALYQAMQEISNIKVAPSDNQSEDAKKLWGQPNRSFGSSTSNLWYHLTDNEKFELDSNYEPEDNATHIYQRTGKGIYLSQQVETWVNGHNYWRPFVVEFEVDPTVKGDKGVHGKYGGEMFVPATSFDKLKILRVIPLDAYAREEFGSYGWIESEIGKEFDTDQPLTSKEVYPFKGYRYSGPDVRNMSSAETTRLKRMLKTVKGSITSAYTDHPSTWIHYSRIPEVKVNPQTMFRDPAGIYLFPSDFTPIGNWTKFPFKFEVTLKDGIKVLDLGLITEEEMKSIWNHFFPGVALNLEDAVHTTKADYWWEQLVNRMMTKQGEANKKFRELGYDAIFDDTGVIHNSEEQLLVLNPKVLKSVKRVENKSSGFQEMVEILKHFEPLAESYGDVKIEGPLKKKGLYAKTPTLTATLEISNGDKNATWSLTVSEIEKGLGVPHHISLSLRYSSPDIKFSIGRSFGYTFQFNDWKQGLADADKEFFLAMDRIFNQVESSVEASVDTTQEDLEKQGYEFEQIIEQNYGKDFLTINVIYSGKRVGQIECTISAVDPTKLNPLGIKVDPAHRRKGIASALYKLAEEYYGLPFGDTLSRSPDGTKFRKAYDKKTTSKLLFKGSEAKPYTEIYRIEKNGKGPYSDPKKDENYNWFWEDPEHGGFEVHPTPSDDGFEPSEINILNGDKFSGNVLFGFKNLEQLNNWFSENSRKALLEDGYKIVKRKASEVWEGKSQVLFRPYMDTVTSKTNTLTKQDWKDIADSIENWVSTADPESFMHLQHISPQLPKEFRQYDGELFRGHKSTKANYAKLKAGARFKIRASSWSIDESEAAKFALNGDAGYYGDQTVRTLFKVTPTSSQVLLNLQEAIEHPILGKLLQRTTKEGILNEGEVILKDIQVSKDNLVNLEQAARDYGYEEYYDEAKEKGEVTAALNVEFHTVLLDFFECSSEKDFNFFNLQREISQEDIYEEHPYQTDFPNGLEQKPHVTVLFGLVHEHDLFPLREYFSEQPPIKYKIGEITAFRNEDKPYDVLVLKIESKDLEKHHWHIRDNHETQTSFPDYKAHMTLAYIKKGTCKDIEGKHDWTGASYTCNVLKFSHKNDYMIDLPLNVKKGQLVDKLDTQIEPITADLDQGLQGIEYTESYGNLSVWRYLSPKALGLTTLKAAVEKETVWNHNTTKISRNNSLQSMDLPSTTALSKTSKTCLPEKISGSLTTEVKKSITTSSLTLKKLSIQGSKKLPPPDLSTQETAFTKVYKQEYIDLQGTFSNEDFSALDIEPIKGHVKGGSNGTQAGFYRIKLKALEKPALRVFVYGKFVFHDPRTHKNPHIFTITKIISVEFRNPTTYDKYNIKSAITSKKSEDPRFRWKYEEKDGMLELEVYDIETGKLAGNALINPIHSDMYEYHFTPDEQEHPSFEKLTEYEYVTTLESLHIEPDFRGLGLSKKILNLILSKARKRYPDYPMYLNASPMGTAKEFGLRLDDLVNLYKRAGFKVLKEWGDNVTMWMESPNEVKTIARAFSGLIESKEVSIEPNKPKKISVDELEEGSDLKEFYELADRDSWEEQIKEEAEAEWERMDDTERLAQKEDLESEYGDHFKAKDDAEMMQMLKDAFISTYIRTEEENSDMTTTMFNRAHLGRNVTLVRFTDVPPDELLPEGWTEGYGPNNLGLTTHFAPAKDGTLLFAFAKKDLKTQKDWKEASAKYGKYGYEFKAPYAVRAWHISDYEWQCVFEYDKIGPITQVWPPQKKVRSTVEASSRYPVEVKFIGVSTSPWQQEFYTCYLNWLCPKLGINPKKITLRVLAGTKGKRFGYVGDMTNKDNVKLSVVLGSPWVSLSRITHEMIHIKQQILNELTVDEGKSNFHWQGKHFISVEEYNNIGHTPDAFKHIPWEQEAYENQDKFPKEFLKSDELYNLSSVKVPFMDMKAMIKEIYEGEKVISSVDLFEQAYQKYSEDHAAGNYSGYRAPSESWYAEMKKNLGPFAHGKNLIYRAVAAPDKESINFEKIGVYWSYNKNGARVYWGDLDNNSIFVITAEVTPDAIDWTGTIEAYMRSVYSGEEEIKLKDKAEVDVVKVEVLEGYGTRVDTGMPEQRAAAEVTT